MRGSPVIQSVIITVVLGLLGFAGMRFIQAGATGMPEISNSENVSLHGGEIPIEIECYFSDKPESYSFLSPDNDTASERLLLKSNSSEESPVFHDVVLKNKADNVIWLDVQWASEKAHGSYFVELLISVGNQEPITRTFRSSSNTLQGTIELDLTNLTDDE